MEEARVIWIDPIFDAIRAGDVGQVDELLTRTPDSASARDENGISAVITAVYYGRLDIANRLIDAGGHVDVFAAAALGMIGRLDALISADPGLVSSHSPDGWTPLALASFFGRATAAEYLLNAGAGTEQRSRNNQGNMPLHAAIAGKHQDLALLLLEAGADVNSQDGSGWTPLHIASHEGPLPLVQLLLAREADPNIRNSDGELPLDTATKQGLNEVIAFLRSQTVARADPGNDNGSHDR